MAGYDTTAESMEVGYFAQSAYVRGIGYLRVGGETVLPKERDFRFPNVGKYQIMMGRYYSATLSKRFDAGYFSQTAFGRKIGYLRVLGA